MEAFHRYMSALADDMKGGLDLIENNVPRIQQILQLPDGKSDEPLNIFPILSGASAIAAAVPSGPHLQGAAAAASGVFALAGELAPKS
jgi:hypothetical protein